MRESEFIEQNREKWQRYEASLERSNQDPELLNQLYVHTTDDLSYSRTFYPNRNVRVYLNGLAQRTFLQIYRGRRGEANRFLSFWTDELPRVVYARRRPLFLALLTFVLAMTIGVISFRIDPVFAEVILGEAYVQMTETFIEEGDPMAVYKQRDQFDMALTITLHNILVAFLTFISGALFCVGSVVMLVRNGVMVGVFQYFFYAKGVYESPEFGATTVFGVKAMSWFFTAGGDGLERLFWSLVHLGSDQSLFRESLLTIWIHGALEISSIVIAGGAGIVLGSGLLFPGTLTRLQAFTRSARDGLKIMLGTVPLFVIAGFLEGYATRQTEVPDAVRLIFILACFGFILWYYVIYPRIVNRRPRVREPIGLYATEANGSLLRLNGIRSLGEQLTFSVTILRRSLGRILGSSLLLTVAYCILSLAFADGTAANRYQFDAFLLADFHNFHELATSLGRGRAFSFTLMVALGFYGMFRMAYAAIYRSTNLVKPPFTRARELRLLGFSLLLASCFAFSGLATALIIFLTFPFLMSLTFARYHDLGTLRQTFRLVYRNMDSSYGIFFIVICVAFPLIYLLDTIVGGQLFTFLDWVIYTDESTIDQRNVALQAFCYYFLFTLLLCIWAVAFAVAFASLREMDEAGDLRERIASVGRKKRLRGMETE